MEALPRAAPRRWHAPVYWCGRMIGQTEVPFWLLDPRDPLMAHEERGRVKIGEFDQVDNVVRVSSALPSDVMLETAFHEFCHASAFHAGAVGWDDERIIGPMSAALYGDLRRNGMAWLPPPPPTNRPVTTRRRGMGRTP